MAKCKIDEENEKLKRNIGHLQRIMLYKDSIINQMFNALILKSFNAMPMRSPYPNINLMGDLLLDTFHEIHQRLVDLKQNDLINTKKPIEEIERPDLESN